MLKRLPGWDYKQPWIYQITIVCADRAGSPLGRLEVRRKGEGWLPLAAARLASVHYRPEEIEARVALSRPLEKPSGRLFKACSDGRLLLLAPAAWPYIVLSVF